MSKRVYYVARVKGKKSYARHDGQFIRDSPTIDRDTYTGRNVTALAYHIGGHYSSFEPVRVTEVLERTFSNPLKWPPSDKIFDGEE